MQNRLRSILFGALLLSAFVFSSGMALPASAATSSSTTSSQVSTVSKSLGVHGVVLPQSRRDYLRGFRDGYNTAVRACRSRRDRFYRHERRETDYRRGWIDGYITARGRDRACQYRRRR